jgi:hypothetical protein
MAPENQQGWKLRYAPDGGRKGKVFSRAVGGSNAPSADVASSPEAPHPLTVHV